jgi:dihydrolipoamide dehydrogenase
LSAGLTEAKAKAAGREVKVGRFPFVGNGKAIALGEDQGMVIPHPTLSEMVHEVVLDAYGCVLHV